MFGHTSIIMLVALAFASLQLQLASSFLILNYTRFSCNTSSGLFASTSGLDTLLSSLSNNLATGFMTNYTTTADSSSALQSTISVSVYGLALCRGDVPFSNCTDCVTATIDSLRSNCPSEKEAIVWREWCTVRYSDRYILSTLEVQPNVTLVTANAAGGNSWAEVLNGTLIKVTAKAAVGGGGKRFATGEAAYTSLSNIYALAECTPDLKEADCKECFQVALASLDTAREGSTALLPSCSVRYELYPFYFNGTDTSLAPFPSPVEYAVTDLRGNRRHSKAVITAVVLLALVLVIVLTGTFIYLGRLTKNKRRIQSVKLGRGVSDINPPKYTYRDLRGATENFSNDKKIGKGGFGVVYKGLLNDREIAVKKLDTPGDDFKSEVVSLAKVKHQNIVSLLGYCSRGKVSYVVYEFVPNPDLHHFLDPRNQRLLQWPTRYNIIKGIASGMSYLHEGPSKPIIHRDLKASNILLDENMQPKIGDFGLARILVEGRTHKTTRDLVGTRGYVAPEYFQTHQYSKESDVYSFGVLVLEIVSGKLIHMFPDLLTNAWTNWENRTVLVELLDPVLSNDVSRISGEVTRCVEIGLACIQNKDKRPSMSRIVHLLDPSNPNNLPSLERPTPGFNSGQAVNPQSTSYLSARMNLGE